MKKMTRLLGVSLSMLLTAVSLHAQTLPTCTVFNKSWEYTPKPFVDKTGHTSASYSDHEAAWGGTGGCTYSGGNGSGYCSAVCQASAYGGPVEEGPLLNPLLMHTPAYKDGGGSATVEGGGSTAPPPAACGVQMGVEVTSCMASIGGGCGGSVTISGGIGGINGTITFNPPTGAVWYKTDQSTLTCAVQLSPSASNPTCGIIPPPPKPEAGGAWDWEGYPNCSWVFVTQPTPIIIDTDGSGFHLTSAEAGIKWNFYGNRHPIQIAWTAEGSTNGWLALDDGSGTITSAKQLFSNVAAQPANPSDPNAPDGFNDLSQYCPGGHGPCRIDAKDPVWTKLLVWIDSNHDGVSQPNELHHLSDLGITGIDTGYVDSPMTDQFGNRFHLKGRLSSKPDDHTDRVIYDVYLTTANTTSNQTTASNQ